jgi:hypothetical protein
MKPAMKRFRFGILLATLLLLALVYPFLVHFERIGLMLLLDLITTLILLSSVHVISDSRRQFFTATAVVLPAIVVIWGAHFSEAVPDEIAAAPSDRCLKKPPKTGIK